MSGGIAEIGQHAVSQVFGEEPVEPTDRLGEAAMIGTDHRAVLFGIEARGQHRRIDEIAEHHSQLSPFGLARSAEGWGGRKRCLGCWLSITQCGDGIEQPAAVTDRRDAKLAQIVGRKPVQHLPVNIVIAERGHVLFEPEAAQPFGHIHRSCPETASLGDHYTPAVALCPGCLRRAQGRPKALFPVSSEAVTSTPRPTNDGGRTDSFYPTKTPATDLGNYGAIPLIRSPE